MQPANTKAVQNREAIERKISEVFDMLELGNTKEAMRKVRTLLDKGGGPKHPVERLSYRIAEMYVLEKSNRRQEALASADEIIKEIVDSNIGDQPLLELLDSIL